MTSPVFRPSQPVPASWTPAGGWTGVGAASATPSSRSRMVATQGGPLLLPAGMTDQETREFVTAYDAYIARLTQLWQESSGVQKRQIEEQIKDAQQARLNEMEIARLREQSAKYGVDAQTQTALEDRMERARQFDLSHGLEMQNLGLRRAQTATEYMATPDRYAQAGNFLALSGRVLAGQPGIGAYGSDVAPRPNTESDFAVLANGGNPNAGRGSALSAVAQGKGAGTDARVKAIETILKANPPSSGTGLDENDFAVLNASRAIMNLNLTPQQQATINSNPDYRSILNSNMRNLGESPDSWWNRQRRSLPGQGSVRAG